MLNGIDPDQDGRSVGPVLGPNCLHRLSAEDKKSPLARKEFKLTKLWDLIVLFSEDTIPVKIETWLSDVLAVICIIGLFWLL